MKVFIAIFTAINIATLSFNVYQNNSTYDTIAELNTIVKTSKNQNNKTSDNENTEIKNKLAKTCDEEKNYSRVDVNPEILDQIKLIATEIKSLQAYNKQSTTLATSHEKVYESEVASNSVENDKKQIDTLPATVTESFDMGILDKQAWQDMDSSIKSMSPEQNKQFWVMLNEKIANEEVYVETLEN